MEPGEFLRGGAGAGPVFTKPGALGAGVADVGDEAAHLGPAGAVGKPLEEILQRRDRPGIVEVGAVKLRDPKEGLRGALVRRVGLDEGGQFAPGVVAQLLMMREGEADLECGRCGLIALGELFGQPAQQRQAAPKFLEIRVAAVRRNVEHGGGVERLGRALRCGEVRDDAEPGLPGVPRAAALAEPAPLREENLVELLRLREFLEERLARREEDRRILPVALAFDDVEADRLLVVAQRLQFQRLDEESPRAGVIRNERRVVGVFGLEERAAGLDVDHRELLAPFGGGEGGELRGVCAGGGFELAAGGKDVAPLEERLHAEVGVGMLDGQPDQRVERVAVTSGVLLRDRQEVEDLVAVLPGVGQRLLEEPFRLVPVAVLEGCLAGA